MAVEGNGPREPADALPDGDVQDAVPPEWIRMLERQTAVRASEAAARRAERRRRLDVASWAVPAIVVAVFVIVAAVVEASTSASTSQAPAALPSPVQAFAQSLRGSQSPNAAGVTVVDATDAPGTWRVAWVTPDAAFCFAFVHESEPPQTVCDPPGSARAGLIRIAGELTDAALDQPELFACGYVKNSAGYVDVDDDAVVGALTDVAGSELGAFCVQLPEGMTPDTSFTVAAEAVTATHGNSVTVADVTATYR